MSGFIEINQNTFDWWGSRYRLPYAIQQLSDGRYFTYVADPRKLEGRRQIKRESKAELFQFLIAYYGLAEEIQTSKTFGKLFGEWVEYKKRFLIKNVRNRTRYSRWHQKSPNHFLPNFPFPSTTSSDYFPVINSHSRYMITVFYLYSCTAKPEQEKRVIMQVAPW